MAVGKTTLIIALILVLSIIIIAGVRLLRYWLSNKDIRHPQLRISEAFHKFKTGDIILFIPHANGFTNSLLTGDIYSHGGIIVAESPESVGISEATFLEELAPTPGGGSIKMPAHAATVPALLRMKNYRGTCFWMPRSRPLDAERERRAFALAAERHPYPHPASIIAQVLLGIKFTRGRHCFEHLGWFLDSLGLTPLDREGSPLQKAGSIRICREIARLPGRELADGSHYLEPIQLIYDL